MKKYIPLIVFISLLISCDNKSETLIAKHKVGEITSKTTEKELFEIFSKDSVVKIPSGKDYVNEYAVYDKEGNHILSVFPPIPNDSVKKVDRVQVFSPKYKTEAGISTDSPFKDVKINYSIKKIDPTFRSAVVYLEELDAAVILDKKDLGLKEFDMNKISVDQVPDMARIKYIDVWF